MTVKFQADADLHQALVRVIVRREPAIDFQTAKAARLRGLSDPDVLAFAAREDRIIVSHDQSSMPIHFADFIMTEVSPGLIIVPQTVALSVAVEELILIWAASEAQEWVNRITFIPL